MQDIREMITPAVEVASGDHTTSQTGAGVDIQGYNALAFFVLVGVITGTGTIVPKIQHRDAGGAWADAGMADVVYSDDSLSALPALTSGENMRFGYCGIKQEVRVVFTVAGTITAGNYECLSVLGKPNRTPARF